jgi:hypothetical protein
MVKRPLIQIAYSLGLNARFAPPMAIERGTLIGLDRFLEIGIGNTRDWQCSLALVLGETRSRATPERVGLRGGRLPLVLRDRRCR